MRGRARAVLGALALATAGLAAIVPAAGGVAGELTFRQSEANCLSRWQGDRCAETRGLRDLKQLVVSADGRNLYAATDHGIVVLSRDPRTGALAQLRGAAGCLAERPGSAGCGPIRGLPEYGAVELTVSPDNRTVLAQTFEDKVLVLDRARDGSLSQDPGPSGCIGPDPSATVYDGESPEPPTAAPGCEVMEDAPRIGRLEFALDGRRGYMSYGSGVGRVAAFRRDLSGSFELLRSAETCIRSDKSLSEGAPGPCTPVEGLTWNETALSDDGLNLYASSDRAIIGFATEPLTGAIAPRPLSAGCISNDGALADDGEPDRCSAGRHLTGLSGLTVSADGRRIYAVNRSTDTLVAVRRGLTGTLSQPSVTCASEGGRGGCRRVVGMKGPTEIALAPDGASAYVPGWGEEEVAGIALGSDGAGVAFDAVLRRLLRQPLQAAHGILRTV